MNNQKMTAEDAPRDLAELKAKKRFRLKDLAMKIGLGETSIDRASIAQMNVDELANLVLNRLNEIDNAGGAAPAPEPVEAAPEPAKPAPKKKNPRKNGVSAAAPAEEPPVGLEPVLGKLDELQEVLTNLATAMQTQAQLIEGVQGALANMDHQNRLGMALNLLAAEELIGGARPEILKAAQDDLEMLTQMLEGNEQAAKQ